MPIYEYACTACGERTEVRQSFDEPPLQDCSLCGGKLRKLFSPVGIVFRGSGFYATDSRGSSKGAGDGAQAKSKPKSKEPAGGNAAPAAKSD